MSICNNKLIFTYNLLYEGFMAYNPFDFLLTWKLFFHQFIYQNFARRNKFNYINTF